MISNTSIRVSSIRCLFCLKSSDTQCCERCINLHWENVRKRQLEAEESYRQDEQLGA